MTWAWWARLAALFRRRKAAPAPSEWLHEIDPADPEWSWRTEDAPPRESFWARYSAAREQERGYRRWTTRN
jgi:hypothetical protein